MNKMLLLLVLTTFLITGCTINDRNHNIAKGFEIAEESETKSVYKKPKYFVDKDMLNEHLNNAIKNRDYKESVFIVTCSVYYNDCATIEIDIDSFIDTNNTIKKLKFKEIEAKYISIEAPMYLWHNYSGKERIVSLSHDFFIMEKIEEINFESSQIQIPKGHGAVINYKINLNENYTSNFEGVGYFGLINVNKG